MLTMMTGAALFAAEACKGSHPGTADTTQRLGARSAPKKDDSTRVDHENARGVFAQGSKAFGGDTIARLRDDDGVARAR